MSGKSEDVIKHRQKRKQELVQIMGGKCAICGYDKYIGALEFHHINPIEKKYGLSSGNCKSIETDIEEAQKCILLCANCHREVEGGFIQKKLNSSFQKEIAELILQDYKKQKEKTKKYCIDCGKEIHNTSIRCPECNAIYRQITERPNREELKKLIREKSFSEIGRMFGVSDNSVRKWCDKVNLPRKVSDIKKFSNEDWELI